MKTHLNKQLMAQVATLFEETPDTNPCAGRSINLSFVFTPENVSVSEIEISSCDEEFVFELGQYDWTLLDNQEIKVDFTEERIGHGYTDDLILHLKGGHIVGTVTHLNGSKTEHVFEERLSRSLRASSQ